MASGLGNETVLQCALLPVAGASQLASFQHAVPLACWSLVQLLSTLLFSVSYTQCKVVRPHVDNVLFVNQPMSSPVSYPVWANFVLQATNAQGLGTRLGCSMASVYEAAISLVHIIIGRGHNTKASSQMTTACVIDICDRAYLSSTPFHWSSHVSHIYSTTPHHPCTLDPNGWCCLGRNIVAHLEKCPCVPCAIKRLVQFLFSLLLKWINNSSDGFFMKGLCRHAGSGGPTTTIASRCSGGPASILGPIVCRGVNLQGVGSLQDTRQSRGRSLIGLCVEEMIVVSLKCKQLLA